MRVRFSLVLPLLLWLTPAHADSGELVMAVEISTTLTDRQARVVLSIANRSRVPVFELRAQLKSARINAGFPPAQLLPAGGYYQQQADVQLPDSLLGANFHVPVLIEYSDSDGVTITTIALARFIADADSPALFALTPAPVSLGNGCRETVVKVENLQDFDSSMTLELVAIPGIAVKPARRSAELGGGATAAFTFELCNGLTISKGQFPYYAIASARYRKHLVQRAANSYIDIEIVSLPTRFFQNAYLVSGLAMTALVLLFLLWVRAIFKHD